MRHRRDFLKIGMTAIVAGALSRRVGMAQEATPPPDTERKPVQFIARPDGGGDGDLFVTELAPGASTQLTMFVSNEGTIPFALDVFMSDVGTAPNGGLVMAPQGTERTGQTTWVDLADQVVELQPGEEQAITIGITVPTDAAAGQYINAVAVQTVDAYEIEGNTSFLQRVRKVLPLYVIVPGEMIPAFALGDPTVEFGSRGPVIQIPIENTGNVRIAPEGPVTIYDATGVELATFPVILGSVFPGDATTIEIPLTATLPAGDYTLSAELTETFYEITQSLDQVPLVMPEPPVQTTSAISLTEATVTPNGDPVQFTIISVTLNNAGAVVPSAKLTVHVARNGELVEDFVLASSLSIPEGPSTVEQRYFPLDGFAAGTWTFSLTLESVDATSGLSTPLLTQENFATLEVS